MMGEISERYFNDLFICCDEEKINKISVPKATELFRSASLSNEIIQEVSYKKL
jgi:RalBP1-associated Eps domain-containing protein